jgi:hypothetical protein
MGDVAAKYPEDHEAKIFYALALAVAADPGVPSLETLRGVIASVGVTRLTLSRVSMAIGANQAGGWASTYIRTSGVYSQRKARQPG